MIVFPIHVVWIIMDIDFHHKHRHKKCWQIVIPVSLNERALSPVFLSASAQGAASSSLALPFCLPWWQILQIRNTNWNYDNFCRHRKWNHQPKLSKMLSISEKTEKILFHFRCKLDLQVGGRLIKISWTWRKMTTEKIMQPFKKSILYEHMCKPFIAFKI